MAARFEFPNPPHTRPCRLERVHTPTAHLFRKCSNGAFCTSKQRISQRRNDRVLPQPRGGRPHRSGDRPTARPQHQPPQHQQQTVTQQQHLYSPLSPPVSSYTWPFIRARWRYRPRSTPRASTSERPARGAVLYTGQLRPCIEHKGPPSTKNMHTKDGHDSRGRNYKAETQLPTFAWASLPI